MTDEIKKIILDILGEEEIKSIDKYYGLTMHEYIKGCLEELKIDAIGLWQIVGNIKDFGLSKKEANSFCYRYILELINHGAKPVVGGVNTDYHWVVTNDYGDKPEEIADNVTKKWHETQNTPNDIADMGGLWFARPEIYEEKKTDK